MIVVWDLDKSLFHLNNMTRFQYIVKKLCQYLPPDEPLSRNEMQRRDKVN